MRNEINRLITDPAQRAIPTASASDFRRADFHWINKTTSPARNGVSWRTERQILNHLARIAESLRLLHPAWSVVMVR
jgi:hypothetical protein